MKRVSAALFALLAGALTLLVGLAGLALVTLGVYWLSPAAGLIVGGAALLLGVLLYERGGA